MSTRALVAAIVASVLLWAVCGLLWIAMVRWVV